MLVDLDGRVVRRWQHTHPLGLATHVTPDGGLLRCARSGESATFGGRGGEGGRLERWSATGELVWHYELHDERRLLHHDAVLLPNGNVLAIAWEWLDEDQVFAAGRRGSQVPTGGLLSDMLLEIRPTGTSGGEIVWQWRAIQHIVQDTRPKAPSFGDPASTPGRIDVDFDLRPWAKCDEDARSVQLAPLGYVGGAEEGAVPSPGRRALDWLHTNSVDYDPVHDLVLLSVPGIGEVWVIDHSTTTAEARTGSGGRQGRGGDILWRWGNPNAHGVEGTRQLFGQHDARWLEGMRILVFDNGAQRPDKLRSRVLEVEVPLSEEGRVLPPARDAAPPRWIFDGGSEPFYSRRLSGAQRLPNGNTLITIGERAQVVEVTRDGAIAWRARVESPFADPTGATGGTGLFRAMRVPFQLADHGADPGSPEVPDHDRD